jgi:type IV pilus assembly protein PilW
MELSMKRFPKIRSDSGFTLIELLITIAISGIVLSGLTWVFTTTNWAYKRQDETATLQQNLRVAKMNLERDIRMAGCGFGTAFNYLSGVGVNPDPNTIYPLANINADALNANSDSLTISYVNYSDPCSGVLPQLTATAITTAPPLTFTVSADMNNALPPNPDYTLWNTGVAPCNDALPFFAVLTRSVPAGETTLQSDVFIITGIVPGAPNSTLQYAGLGAGITAIPALSNPTINFFSATQLVTVTYSLNSASRTLMRAVAPNPAQALAEDVEDLQFAFGLDTNNDGDVDLWVNNAALSTAQQTQVRQVRVSILGRSADPVHGQALNTRPAIEDHNAGAAQSHHLRQLLQFDVAARNMMR